VLNMFFIKGELMNKRLANFSFLFCLAFTQVSFGAMYEDMHEDYAITKSQITHKAIRKPSLRRLSSAYLVSLLLSGAVGATTGTIVRYLEKRLDIESSPIGLFLAILGWTIESELRNDIIEVLQKDLNVYGVEYKKGLMFKSAWIASWLAYLHMQ
jgi:hypothetical protein